MSREVVAIGMFDGVHLGHRAILTTAKQIATERERKLVVMTFDPHPVQILYPEKTQGVLTPLELKKQLISRCGADFLFVLKDSVELLGFSPRRFVDDFFALKIHPETVFFAVCGCISTIQRG